MTDEKIVINDMALQYGVLSDNEGYRIYTYPGMTVAEIAFNMMVTARILKADDYIKEEKELFDLAIKYLNDPQYEPSVVNHREVIENDN